MIPLTEIVRMGVVMQTSRMRRRVEAQLAAGGSGGGHAPVRAPRAARDRLGVARVHAAKTRAGQRGAVELPVGGGDTYCSGSGSGSVRRHSGASPSSVASSASGGRCGDSRAPRTPPPPASPPYPPGNTKERTSTPDCNTKYLFKTKVIQK